MKCPDCKIGDINTEIELIDEKKYLIESCSNCDKYDKIYLHKEIEDEIIETKID